MFWNQKKLNKIYSIMKTLIVLIEGICLLSTSASAQSVEKKQAKIESKNVVLAKKTPVKLTKKQPLSSKTTATKKEEKKIVKKPVAIKPKK